MMLRARDVKGVRRLDPKPNAKLRGFQMDGIRHIQGLKLPESVGVRLYQHDILLLDWSNQASACLPRRYAEA